MPNANSHDISSVTTTVGSRQAAQALARVILDRRLAACVQIEDGLTSLYRWQGELCEEPEARLVIKTLPACDPLLQALFAEQHPYDVPQFLAVRMDASEAYFRWASAQVAQPSEDS